MISVAEARQRILDGLAPLTPEIVSLAEADGRISAAPLRARLTHPPAAVSSMDGYALRAADALPGARLRVIGAAPAGRPFEGALGHGEAVRLFTGSLVPAGADAVLAQEDARADAGSIVVAESVPPGRFIRPAGMDFTLGDTLIPAARRLTARDIGLAAAANHPWIPVIRRPRIAVLATGDELCLPGEAPPPGGIVSSGGHALAAFIRAQGAVPLVLPIAGDSRTAIGEALAAAAGADLLLTAGGASVGDHDLVRAGLEPHGLALDFWKIAMRPGKPLMFGRAGRLPVLGLPGNPVSALVCALLFLRPAIARLSGLPQEDLPSRTATLRTLLPANDGREDYLRAGLAQTAEGLEATPFALQDSGMLASLARADALIVRPAFAPALAAGEEVRAIPLHGLL